jgi:hypothetical protein
MAFLARNSAPVGLYIFQIYVVQIFSSPSRHVFKSPSQDVRRVFFLIYYPEVIKYVPPHRFSPRSILALSSHLRLGLPSGLFPSGFPTNVLYAVLISPIRATCPAYRILLGMILIIFDEEYKL